MAFLGKNGCFDDRWNSSQSAGKYRMETQILDLLIWASAKKFADPCCKDRQTKRYEEYSADYEGTAYKSYTGKTSVP